LSINENKLEELEQKTLDKDNEGEQASMDVFCIIDRSGSMCGSKLDNVKQSLHYLLDLLKPEDRISIILFDDRSELILSPKMIGKSRKIIEQTIDSIQDSGTTNIKAGLETCFDTIVKRKTRNQVTGVLLLSDGQDNQYFQHDKRKVDDFFEKWYEKLTNDPFVLHSFGYGDDHDEEILNYIAQKRGGNFYYVQDIELVSDNFIDCLGGLSSVIGKNAYVDINLLQSSIFPEIRFAKTYGSLFSGQDALIRKLK